MNQIPKFYVDDNINWTALSEAIDGVDERAIEYFKTLDDGNGTIMNSSASMAGMAKFLTETGHAFDFAKVNAVLLNAALNAGIMFTVSIAIQSIAKAIDYYVNEVNNANKAMNGAMSDYQSVKSSLKSITTELETQRSKIEALQSKDKLTYAEQGQLKELQLITKELALQQDIEERHAQTASAEAAVKAVNAYETQYGDYDISESKVQTLFSLESFGIAENYENDISGVLAELQRAKELLNQAEAEYTKAVDDGINVKWYASELQRYIDMVNIYHQSLNTSIADLSDKRIALQTEYNRAVDKKNLGISPLTTTEQKIIETYEEISNAIRLIYQYTNQSAWNNIEISNIVNTKDVEKTENELIEMAKSGILSPEIIKEYPNLNNAIKDSELFLKNGQTAAEAFCNEIYALIEAKENFESKAEVTSPLSISETVSQLNTRLKPAFDSLASAYQAIFTSGGFSSENVDLSMLDSIKSSLDALSGELLTDIDYSSYENLVRVLTDSSSTADSVRDAFTSMANSILNTADVTDGLSDQTLQVVGRMLEQLGCANAMEAATEALNTKTEALALQNDFASQKGMELINAQDYQVVAFLDNAGASEAARLSLRRLIYQEQVFNTRGLTTKDRITKLNELAKAYGDTAIESITASAMVQMEHNGNFDIDKAFEEIQNAVNKMDAIKVDYSPAAVSPSGAGSSEYKDTWKEAYQEELDDLEHLHNMEEITDRQFYEKLSALNEKYFNDTSEHHEKYLDDYLSNEEKAARGLKDAWTKHWEDYKSSLDKTASYAQRILSSRIESLKNDQENEVSGYEAQEKAVDRKIKALEDEKATVQSNYQAQIDAVQETIDGYQSEIDKLKEVNDEKNRQLQLEQDLYTLERLRGQKTQKEYVAGKGIVYRADDAAIRDQEQKVEADRMDIRISGYEKLIEGLESQQDALKDRMDSVTGAIDAQIERLNEQKDGIQDKIDAISEGYESQIESLEKYREKWAEVSDYQAHLDEETIARQLLGVDAEQQILDMRQGVLDGFINQYRIADENLAAISDARLNEVGGLLEQMQASSDTIALLTSGISTSMDNCRSTIDSRLSDYTTSWSGFNTELGSIVGVTGNGENGSPENPEETGEGSGDTDSILGTLQTGGKDIAAVLDQEWVQSFLNTANLIDEICENIVTCINEMTEKSVNSCRETIIAINLANAAKANTSSSNKLPDKFIPEPYVGADGSADAYGGIARKPDNTLVGELGPELIVSPKTNSYRIAGEHGAEFTGVDSGDIIFNHRQTSKLLSDGHIDSRGSVIRSAPGPATVPDLLSNLIRHSPSGSGSPIPTALTAYTPHIQPPLTPDMGQYDIRNENVTLQQDININCPNVTNSTGADYIIKAIKNLPSDAMQYVNRR